MNHNAHYRLGFLSVSISADVIKVPDDFFFSFSGSRSAHPVPGEERIMEEAKETSDE